MTFFLIRLKNACTITFWLAAAMIPLTVLAAGAIFSRPEGLSIQIGVYGDLPVEGVRYSERERLHQDVANRRLELGYAKEAADEKITLYTSTATMTDRVVNLLVAAAYLEAIAGEIGARALSFYMEADPHRIQVMADEILIDGPLMERAVVLYGEGQDGLTARPYIPFRRMFHGLLALFAQLMAMLCAYAFSNKNERDILRRLKATAGRAGSKWFGGTGSKVILYSIAGVAVIFVLTGAVMAAAILPGAWMFPGVWTWHDIPAFMVYLAVISGLAAFLAHLLPDGAYPGVLVLGFIFTALMGGVFFDLREVIETVGFLRFLFPSHYYMAGVGMPV